ncbi:response regulator [Sediminicoccus rosea]|uniref:Response regulator n=1 Tax=Sediminicoccus rosea TaxID=1225128 RepID=A0ABZ0PG62_9PROT|nr:response regulator [Sediminicoccus rosea]WPB84372.1 response regulator [Sediminicoccus rosea]
MDEELLAAFREEFAPLCAALASAADLAAAQRVLAQMQAMADGMEIAPLQARLRALAETEALAELQAAAPALAAFGAAEPDAEPPPPVERGPVERGPVRTLIVDDSAMMRRLLRGILAGDARFAVVGEAADGAAGLAAQAELRPDLTLLDLEMPVLDGLGFLAEWALSGHGQVVVVSSAAHPGSPAALEVLRRGAWAAVAKPSGALSPDLAERSGAEILATLREATGLATSGLAA